LLDERAACPLVFKGEKVLRLELDLLREWGLYEPLLPRSGRIGELPNACDGRIVRRTPVEQIGLSYAELVNTLRMKTPWRVRSVVASLRQLTVPFSMR